MRSKSIYSSRLLLGMLFAALGWTGCWQPSLMPAKVLSNHTAADGSIRRAYDRDGDGREDYVEDLIPAGRVVALHIDEDLDGTTDVDVALDQLATAKCRHLLIILDSIPFDLVMQQWQAGRLRLFAPPSRIISPFPVMTDLSLDQFFGTSPSKGIESTYFDGRRLTNGYTEYFAQGNACWMSRVDSFIAPNEHAGIYLFPDVGVNRELSAIERTFFRTQDPSVIGYSVGTSAGGSRFGQRGHERNLEKVDRFCRAIMLRTRGQVQITLMSDHGHNLTPSRYFPLHLRLRAMGYSDGRSLRRDRDIVVPRFGPVTCAGVYTSQPRRVAEDAVTLEEIELAAFKQDEIVHVLSHSGRATIEHDRGRFRYRCESGDPLMLQPLLDSLQAQGRIDEDGFIDDQALWEVTAVHTYPDAVQRLWHAFDGLMQYPPDVLVSIRDGYCYGTSFFNLWIRMASAHGSLRLNSTSGFVMTTAGALPPVLRMRDVRAELKSLGLALD